jgi:16S rRNA processing protein RimM
MAGMHGEGTDPVTPALLEVGRVEKPHGVRGEVIVRLVTNRSERVAPGSELTTPAGTLRVVSATPHHGRWIVAFAGLHDREGADALRGTLLLAPPLDDPDELWVHELIGCDVVDVGGVSRGMVVEVEANPASDLLVLDTGALVPLRFVVHVSPGRIEVDVPAGLFDPH